MEIVLLLALILLNGVFAMSEIAVVTAKRGRLGRRAEAGDGGAAAALRLAEDPNRFLSTVQVGITSISLVNGIVGEAVLAGPLGQRLQALGLPEQASQWTASVLAVGVVTYVSILLGELVPKRLGQLNPEGVARTIARPMTVLARIATPFVKLLSLSTEGLLRLVGGQRPAASVTEEDIDAVLEEGSQAGVIEDQERDLVRNVFGLGERRLAALMVPASAIAVLDAEASPAETVQRLQAAEHSHYVVCRGGLQQVLGVANAARLLATALRGEPVELSRGLEAPVYVPQTLTGLELLQTLKGHGAGLALVVDEHGQVQGLVTVRDLLEAIAGEFRPAPGEADWAVRRDDGSWLLDGRMPAAELQAVLELAHLPDEDGARYSTLSGLVLLLLGRMPAPGDRVACGPWRLEVIDMDDRRIDKVLASPLPDGSAGVQAGVQADMQADMQADRR